MKWYLAGPISMVEDDSYIAWRQRIGDAILNIGHCYIDPIEEEKKAVDKEIFELYGIEPDTKKLIREFIDKGFDVSYKTLAEFIINLDKKLVNSADGLIVNLSNIVKIMAGTMAEIFFAYEQNKPILIIGNIEELKESLWLYGMASKFFNNEGECIEYIKNLN